MKALDKVRFAFVAMVVLAVAGCGDKVKPGTTSRSGPVVKGAVVAEVEETQEPQVYEAMGTVRALTTSRLASKLMGTVLKINVEEGDHVKKGQPLVLIDDRQVKAQLDKARAALAQARKALRAAIYARNEAKAARDLAYATYRRYLNLQRQNAVSAQEFDEVRSRYLRAEAGLDRAKAMVQTARARVREAEAAVAAATVARKDAVVVAPEDGVVSAKMADVGDLVAPGTPLLTIDSTGNYRVDVLLPESHIDQVSPGEKVQVVIPALGQVRVDGTISAVTPSADPASRSFLVKVRLPQILAFKSGMFARVFVPMPGKKRILIPRKAVIRVGQIQGVYVVDGNNIAHFRLVRTGKGIGEKIEILSGLKAGQRIVCVVPPNMVDGAKLEGIS